jgi:hypothetical protein
MACPNRRRDIRTSHQIGSFIEPVFCSHPGRPSTIHDDSVVNDPAKARTSLSSVDRKQALPHSRDPASEKYGFDMEFFDRTIALGGAVLRSCSGADAHVIQPLESGPTPRYAFDLKEDRDAAQEI